jgi:hypothetical protein
LWGILNAIRLKVSNGMTEAKNNSIQRIKKWLAVSETGTALEQQSFFIWGI